MDEAKGKDVFLVLDADQAHAAASFRPLLTWSRSMHFPTRDSSVGGRASTLRVSYGQSLFDHQHVSWPSFPNFLQISAAESIGDCRSQAMDRNGMKTDSKYLPVSTWTLNIMYEEGFSAVDPLLNQLGSSATYWSFFSKAESNLNFQKASEKS